MAAEELVVAGARVHNLKNVDIRIPRGKLAVFTGVSGSGKSSLAFDTIFAEGQRRYVESLSAYARQFLGQMDKPDVDFIEGLSPAVSIDQKSTNRNPRSTVGTITEIYDYLRLLFARVGVQHCPVCNELVKAQSVQNIVDQLLTLEDGVRYQVLAPVIRGRKGEYADLLSGLRADGFSRVLIDDELVSLDADELPTLSKTVKHNIEVVVDRLVAKKDIKKRLTDSIETALRLTDGLVIAHFVDKNERRKFSQKRACPNDHELELDEIEPRTFSFNAPYGSCLECTGLGFKLEVDPDLIIPDTSLSLNGGAIEPWKGNGFWYQHILEGLSAELGFSLDMPWNKISKEDRDIILFGKHNAVDVTFRTRFGRMRTYSTDFEGVIRMIHRRHAETESEASRDKYEEYMREVPCAACKGARLRPEVLAVKILDKSISDVTALSISEASEFINSLELTGASLKIGAEILKEIRERLRFLLDVGLNYLTLARSAGTLSGGEAQRIRLATQIGSGLVGVLYVLDEPSIGLHQRDNARLIATLKRLRDLGNTLIVVEHDEETIDAADWIVDIGPQAGELGGKVIYCGPQKGFVKVKDSLTSDYIYGRKQIAFPKPNERRKVDKTKILTVVGAKENNLKNIDVKFPVGVFTAITGVSGSGKSSLVNSILYRALAGKLNRAKVVPGRHKSIKGIEHVDKVIHVDQGPIGRTPRSNPATYTGVWDKVRNLFASTNEAKERGYGPGRFSFNVNGGRCEACSGDGTIKIEMNFLPDVYVQCEVCKGKRYNRETLEIHYKGKSVAEVLDMPIRDAAEFFASVPAIARYLDTLVDVGLGYVRLGQSATTLSGGESQRVKLASELQKRATGSTVYILDEPTTGLHFDDINKLLMVLQNLTDRGNTVIVIEHNLDVIRSADWVIDMGPEGGSGGGTVIAQGPPEQVAKSNSATGEYLSLSAK